MIVPGKYAPGLKGFPAPAAADNVESYLLFLFPDSEWAQYVLGACENLVYPWNWYDAGGISPDEAAEAFRLIVEQAPYNFREATVDAPWWDEDSADDTDDEAPIQEQPWYGEIVILDDRLTFVENAFIYVVGAFIAYSGAVSAAISFVPIARQFVVTAKTNPLGGIIQFLRDGMEIGRVDTYAPADGVISTPLIFDAPAMGFRAEADEPHVFWARLLEDNPHDLPSVSMTIIRSRLSESDVSGNPSKIRFNTETGVIQTSPDGGVTWIDNPQADPRYGMSYKKPPLGTGTAQCDSAANRVKWLHDFIDSLIASLNTAGDALIIANIALGFYELLFAEAGVLVDLLIELGSIVVGVGASALDAAFTSEVYDALLCLFFCDSLPDGSYDDTNFNQLVSDIDTSSLSETVKIVLNAILGAQGWNGVNNAGVIGGQTGDCDACECLWCYEWDFTVSDGGWDADSSLATYSPGIGWVAVVQNDSCSDHAYIYIHRDLGLTTSLISRVEVSLTNGRTFLTTHLLEMFSTGTGADLNLVPNGSGTAWAADSTVLDVYKIGVQFNDCGDPSGLIIPKIRVKGAGDMPAFTGGTAC